MSYRVDKEKNSDNAENNTAVASASSSKYTCMIYSAWKAKTPLQATQHRQAT